MIVPPLDGELQFGREKVVEIVGSAKKLEPSVRFPLDVTVT